MLQHTCITQVWDIDSTYFGSFQSFVKAVAERSGIPAAHHQTTHASHAETSFSPRQLMKNFEAEVSAPDMSSSVVTIPGDRLCSATLRMPCAKQGQVSTGRSWFRFAFSHPLGDAILAPKAMEKRILISDNVGKSFILFCVHTVWSQKGA